MGERIEYWDSCVFIAFLNRDTAEPKEGDIVEELLEEAREGNLLIVTSFMTLTEVVKLDGSKPKMAEDQKKLEKFFRHDYFEWVEFDREIAEAARRLMWNHPLSSKDAVHLASAARLIELGVKLDAVCSFNDRDFARHNGNIAGINCQIRQPTSRQMLMRLDDARR